jgi:hypothetical protein
MAARTKKKALTAATEGQVDAVPVGSMEALHKLDRDLRQAATKLGKRELRYLVDVYYQMQRYRIASAAQWRGNEENAEPNRVFAWTSDNMMAMENNIVRALHEVGKNYIVGKWALSIYGIGPVITAGLLAHIDIRIAKTYGHIWRFAGLDCTVQWMNKEDCEKLIRSHNPGVEELSFEDVQNLCKVLGRSYADTGVVIRDLFGHEVADELNASPDKAPELVEVIEHGGTVTIEKAAKAFTRRPWNTPLKTLCAYKMGESFVKVQNNKNDFYGKIFRERKDIETAKNERGEFKEQAAFALAKFKFRKTTDAYGHYSAGRLSPAHIHARARRYAVKIFLAHLHTVMFEEYYQQKAPLPYILRPELGSNHRHYIAPPNWPEFPQNSFPAELQGASLRDMGN